MRIDEIAIDGFGLLRDRRIALAPGLTLIRGENEAGKSTVLAFIRAMLFGFETRGHPALAGGRRGGWLAVTTGDGRNLRIERYGQTGGGGQLRLLDPDGDDLGSELLSRILLGVERTVYANVFAFGLAELAQFANLTAPEIAARIYGAGMGTGATSVVEIENRLEKRRSELFVKQGRNPRGNVLLSEIDDLDARIGALDPPASYERAGARRVELEAALAGLTEDSERAATEAHRFERLRDGWPVWLGLTAARQRLAELPTDRTSGRVLADDALGRLARLEHDLEIAAASATEIELDRRRALAEREARPVDDALLAARPDIERLLAGLSDLRADRSRIVDLEQARADRTEALVEALRRLGPGWDEQRLRKVDDSLVAQNAISGQFRTSLETTERDLATAAIEQAAAEQSLSDARAELAAIEPVQGPAGSEPPVHRARLMTWIGVGLILAILSGIGSLVFGLAIGQALGLALFIGVVSSAVGLLAEQSATRGRALSGASGDPSNAFQEVRLGRLRAAEQRGQTAAKRLERARTTRELAQADWQAWLVEHGLDPDLDREGAGRIMDGALTARDILAARESLEARQAKVATRLAGGEAEVAALLGGLGRPTDDPLVGLEALRRELSSSLTAQAAHDQAAQALERIEARGSANDHAREIAQAGLQALLAAAGAEDAADLRRLVAEASGRTALDGQIRAATDTLIALSGPGEALAGFEADLAGFQEIAQIEAGLVATADHSRSIEAVRAAAYEELGAERDRMTAIEHSAQAADLRQARADRVAELEVLAETWATTTIALELLRRTRSRYEREHRPEVLRTAEGLLAEWTDGRYVKILAPLGRQIQELERGDGAIVPISGLSTGTAEQLYLALRFGLVEHFAREAESLPIVMDDILVNFDPGRAQRAARSIEDLARRHQVLYFTCHPDTPISPAQSIELASLRPA